MVLYLEGEKKNIGVDERGGSNVLFFVCEQRTLWQLRKIFVWRQPTLLLSKDLGLFFHSSSSSYIPFKTVSAFMIYISQY